MISLLPVAIAKLKADCPYSKINSFFLNEFDKLEKNWSLPNIADQIWVCRVFEQ